MIVPSARLVKQYETTAYQSKNMLLQHDYSFKDQVSQTQIKPCNNFIYTTYKGVAFYKTLL